MCRNAVRPSISGISTSSVTTSGCNCSTLTSASSPLIATPATSMSGWQAIASLTTPRINAESSTTGTRMVMLLSTSTVPIDEQLRCQQFRQGSEYPIRLERLEHEVFGPSFEGLHDNGLLTHRGDHRHARRRVEFSDLFERRQTVHFGHGDIHKHRVG